MNIKKIKYILKYPFSVKSRKKIKISGTNNRCIYPKGNINSNNAVEF